MYEGDFRDLELSPKDEGEVGEIFHSLRLQCGFEIDPPIVGLPHASHDT
jgi:hypothetical protein